GADAMHLLAAQPGAVGDGEEAVDLGQTPGDILVLSAADTELAVLAEAEAALGPGRPSLRLANLLQLSHPLSVDLWVERMVPSAKLVVARLLGGAGYWSYGVEQLEAACVEAGVPLALLPGDDKPDPELARRSSVSAEVSHRLWQYLVQGGAANAQGFLAYAASLTGAEMDWPEPRPLLRAGLYWPGQAQP